MVLVVVLGVAAALVSQTISAGAQSPSPQAGSASPSSSVGAGSAVSGGQSPAGSPLTEGGNPAQQALVQARAAAIVAEHGERVTGFKAGVSQAVPLLDDATADTYANADGTLTSNVYQDPVNYQNAQGNWEPINPELSPQADGAITSGGGPVGLRLAGGLGDPDVLTLTEGTASLTFGTPTQGLELPGSTEMTGAVAAQPVKASISGGIEVSYADAWPTTNLEFVSTVDALNQLIVLQAPPAGTGDVVYRFPLSLSGLAARQDADGGIDFLNGLGNVVFNLPAGTMGDSNFNPGSGLSASTSVSYVLGPDGSWLDVVASGTWLRNPARVYPVTIDPSWVSSTAGNQGGQDTFVSTLCTTCHYPNYYSSAESDDVDWIGEYSSSSTGYNETSLYYSGIAALNGTSIVSATWSGFFDWTALCSAEAFWMWQATSPFNLNATWNNGLPYNAGNGVTGSVSANWGNVCYGSRSWANVNITPWVQQWTNGSAANDGIIITSDSNFSSNYWMQLSAFEGAHPSYVSVTYMTPPGAPTGVTATAGNAQATVSWVAPASNGGSAITGYRVTPYIGSTAQTATVASASATSTTITGLTNGTAYTFQVAATNAYGTGLATASAAVTPVTVPGAPTGVAATAGNVQATVSWVAPASNGGSAITGYTVTPYVGNNAQTATTTGPTTTSVTIAGLTNGTAYTFRVAATNAVGTGSATASTAVTPMTVPGAPTGVAATAGNAQAAVSWAAPASNGGGAITGYRVTPYIGSTAGTATVVSAPATSTTITGLTNGTAYTLQVAATNAAGTGTAAASAAVTPMTVAGAPTGVTATAGNAQALVSWVAPASNGGSTITGYTVTPYIGTTAQTATTVGATVTSTTIAGLTNGTAYTFQVAAANALGAGPATPSAAVTPMTVPGAPTGVTATAGDGQAAVAWVAPASNGGSAISGYTVTPYAGSTAGTATIVGATVTSTTITGLTNGTAYTFQVTATNAAGSGPAASSAAVQEQGPPTSAPAWSAAAGVGDAGDSAPVAPSNGVGSINGESGALYLTHSDITIGGLGLGLDLDRTYNSPQQAAVNGPFGYGWSSNVTMSLAENTADNVVTITDESGAPVTFTLVGATWTPSSYDVSTLTNSGGTWTYTRWDGDSYAFNGSGQLTSEADRYGNTTTFAYSGGNLSTMTDPSGRTLTFTWTGSNITQVEDPDGQYVTYGYDAAGDLTSFTDQIGTVAGCGCAATNTTTYAYDGSHHLITQTDPLRNSTSYVYSGAGQVTSITPPAGVGGASRQVTYAYAAPAPNETTTTITAPDPNGDADANITVDTYLYALLITQVRGEGLSYAVTTTYLYDPSTLGLVLQVDSPGETTSNTYDLNGNLLSTVITSPSGKVTSTSATYNSLNEPLTQTDADNNVTTDAYAANGELCWSLVGTSSNSCASVPSGATSYTYGTADPGLPTSETDPAGETTETTYDSQGDLLTSTNAAGDETSHTYDVLSRQLTTVNPTGNAAGCGCAAANTTTTTYDPLNHVLTTTAPNGSGGGSVTTNTYDADGNLLTSEDPAGSWTTNTYDADAELCWSLVASSASDNPCTMVPTGATASTYDGDGNVATATDAKGNVTTYAYNALSENVSETVTKASGAETTYTYDAYGNVKTMVSPDGNVVGCNCAATYTTSYTYDADNRLLTTTDPNGYTTTNSYDGNGNVLTVTDGDGNVTTNAYNSLNQLCWTYTGASAQQSVCGSPPSGATITTYEADGHVLTTTDGNGNVTTNAYNDSGQLCWTYLGSSSNDCSSPPGGATVYTYDANGNLLTTTKPNGQTITNAYNTANQLCWTYEGVVSTPSCGSPPTSGIYDIFTYDADGHVLTVADGNGNVTTNTYNAQGEMCWTYLGSSSNGCQSPPAGATVYTYDGNGNQTSITYPSGGIVVYQAYTPNNQPCWTDVVVNGQSPGTTCPATLAGDPAGSTGYAYDASGNLLSEALPNGVTNTYTYDGDGNISAISDKNSSGATVFAATYVRNGDDLVTSDSSQPTSVGQYQYTSKKQVCYAGSASAPCSSPPAGSYDYGYDPAGNLTSDNGTTQAYNSQDELCWSVAGTSSSPCSTPPTGATTYTFDGNGDRTAVTPASGAPVTYSYNTAGQLTQYQPGSGTPTTYAYDGRGLRMSETTGTSTTTFSWNETGSVAQLLQETTGSGATSYVYGPTGSPIEEILPSGTAYYYSSDDLGSTRALTDASGNAQDTETYDPYGNLTASTGSVQNHLLYVGQYLDSENGLYYLRARYYDPTTGQFMTVDPEVAATHSSYSYMMGDPLNGTDPTGLGGPHPSACPSGFALPIGGRCEKISITIANNLWWCPWSSDNYKVTMTSSVWYNGTKALWLESTAYTSFESPMGVYVVEMGGYRSDSRGDLSVWGNIEAWDTSWWTSLEDTEFILVFPRILVHPNGTYQCSGGANSWYGEAEIEATPLGGLQSCE